MSRRTTWEQSRAKKRLARFLSTIKSDAICPGYYEPNYCKQRPGSRTRSSRPNIVADIRSTHTGAGTYPVSFDGFLVFFHTFFRATPPSASNRPGRRDSSGGLSTGRMQSLPRAAEHILPRGRTFFQSHDSSLIWRFRRACCADFRVILGESGAPRPQVPQEVRARRLITIRPCPCLRCWRCAAKWRIPLRSGEPPRPPHDEIASRGHAEIAERSARPCGCVCESQPRRRAATNVRSKLVRRARPGRVPSA